MITAAAMFAKFKGTGLLRSATWTPADGGTPSAPFEARVMKGGAVGVALVAATELAIQCMATDVAGMRQGDRITVDGAHYVLRDRDEANCSADGTLLAYFMRLAR